MFNYILISDICVVPVPIILAEIILFSHTFPEKLDTLIVMVRN